MILGIGTDLLEVARIEATYTRFGSHFVERLLHDRERPFFERTKRKVRFLAMRFAAKEAIVKALGTGFSHGIWIRDIGFVPDRLGKPEVIFSNRGAARMAALGADRAHLTMTDEAGLVVAFAIVEKS